MKFYTILPFIAAVLATVSNLTLYVKSNDKGIHNKVVNSIHEGAAVNYLFLSNSTQKFQYNSTAKSLYAIVEIGGGPEPFYFGTFEDKNYQVIAGLEDEALGVEIADNGELQFDGDVYAAKNIKDPYDYSTEDYFLIDHETNGSIPVKLYAKFSNKNTTKANSSISITTKNDGSSIGNSIAVIIAAFFAMTF
ncbi:predicted protein [Candida tropicalis MYA-3404]|uniref:Cell wall protein RHD3 n=1 Tax=Candida tropicalis (strain ATCC MYA-3404 / T1) TaxID=294747 RepID=C5M2Q9_CANTT|nr:predicted protein [Candida tropicalis MYA-3404]EER35609.1 predicted protein [Candida tropicalis MYA-3404]KAG4409715.1 hypothetical protein JTP64_000353 [Candida tropicalis]